MVAEALLALWFGWSRFGLAGNDNALYTFSFLTLLYFAALSIVSARERRWFWTTMPSKPVMAAVVAETLIGTALTVRGSSGTRAIALVADARDFWLCDGLLPGRERSGEGRADQVAHAFGAVAKPPVDLRAQIARRAYELYEQRGRQDGRAVQDWAQAEREIRKNEPRK